MNKLNPLGALTFILCLFLLFRCVPETQVYVNPTISYSLEDLEVQKILDLQDKQDITSLYPYLRHSDPSYRILAARAFASIRSNEAVDSLIRVLDDSVMEVGAMAAYAIGQSGDSLITEKLVSKFRGRDTIDVDNTYNKAILEATGKIGTLKYLKSIATVKTYRSTDSLLLEGQARAIFNMSLRNIVCDEGTERMVDLLYIDAVPLKIKRLAAHYLARTKGLDLLKYKATLISVFRRQRDNDIIALLATTFGKTKDPEYIPVLATMYKSSKDYKVRHNVIKAMGNFANEKIRDLIFEALRDENVHVSAMAASIFVFNGNKEDVVHYMKCDSFSNHWQVCTKLHGAVLSNIPLFNSKVKKEYSATLVNKIKESKNVYEKVSYVEALSRDPYNVSLLTQMFLASKDPVMKGAMLEGLANIMKNPAYSIVYAKNSKAVKAEIFVVLKSAIQSKDPGLIAIAADIISNKVYQWQKWFKDIDMLKGTLAEIKIPQSIETYNALARCIAYIEGTNFEPAPPAFNHPISWQTVNQISDTSYVAIKTSKGVIRVQLYKKEAPGTVANFINLIQDKFFSGKKFHRVVSGFVVQTGCPRGDGYGALNYTIRSELPPLSYDEEGYIGMASAGNHTEGTQWFINTSSTPHLDGNYTIFGKVTEGMDVVHALEQGDSISEIILAK